MLSELAVKNYKYGVINSLEAKTIPAGAASAEKNWLTKGDMIELARGNKLLGTEVTGLGRITGCIALNRADNSRIIFASYSRKILYSLNDGDTWTEVGTDILPAAANGEDVAFAAYASLSGFQLFFSSKNSGLYKIMLANPSDYSTLYTDTYMGYITISQNRMKLWNTLKDSTSPILSWIDAMNYPVTNNEVIGTGTGSLKTFSDTLVYRAGNAKATCFAIVVTDGVETFTDDRNGVLTGNQGGTGTINYTTGAISVTFANNVANGVDVLVDYQTDDATNNGVADFSYSAPRQAGEGDFFRQDDGGYTLQNMFTYNGVDYCIHTKGSWALSLTVDDLNASNTLHRSKVGMPYWRAGVATGDGIYYIDDTDEKEPKFKLYTLASGSTEVEPRVISNNLDLSDYTFDYGVAYEWGDYILFAGRKSSSDRNDTVFVYDKILRSFDILNYYVSCFMINNGVLLAGSSLSNNVYELFSGYDDDDSIIDNFWEGNEEILGTEELKKVKKFPIQGLIVPDQTLKVYADLDNSGYVEIGEVLGTGNYVDKGSAVDIGSPVIGKTEIGGGSAGTVAYNFFTEFKLRLDKFYSIKIKFVATAIGYVAISRHSYRDIRLKGTKIPKKYRS